MCEMYSIANIMTICRTNSNWLKIQVLQDILRLESNLLCQLGKPLIHIQPCLWRCRRIIKPRLIGEQDEAVFPKLGWIDSFDSKSCFVAHCRGGMPGLDLVTENKTHCRMVSFEGRKDVLVVNSSWKCVSFAPERVYRSSFCYTGRRSRRTIRLYVRRTCRHDDLRIWD